MATINIDDINVKLDDAQSSTIYIDIPGCDDAAAAGALAQGLHIERDLVRDKWAVRKATVEEQAEAEAAAEAAKTAEPAAATA